MNELVIDNNNLQKLLKAAQLKMLALQAEDGKEWCVCEKLRHSTDILRNDKSILKISVKLVNIIEFESSIFEK